MTRRVCDAQHCTDDAGRPGRIMAIVSGPAGAVEVSSTVGACSDDLFVVWHGMDTPAYGCGRHAGGRMVDVAVFRGHRARVQS